MTGHLFGDRYQVGDTLGFGGMSEVHRGRDLRLGRDVAIKVLRADLARDPSFQTRFRREAQNAASLNHPAIVAVYDTGETPGETGTIPYIVMEYVDGETLRDLLKREQSLVPRRAMEIVADVCAALDFSHRHGIVHRDIKPANVMLTRAGAVKVMDFGIARAVADGQATMTATAAVIGTAQYLSPEQARGEAVDARSDVYATGCVLFELLVGAPPFTGDSPVAVAYQHVREDAKAPSEVKPGLPHELDSIVLKALNKNPLNRYQTAAEMRSDLVRALSGQAVHATPVMSDEQRTQLMRATPERVGAGMMAGPSLLAPPRRPIAEEIWEEEEPDRSRKVWGFVGIGVLCLALLAGAIFLTMKFTSSNARVEQVATPAVEGMSQPQAEKSIISAGLIVGKTSQTDNAAPVGQVIKQNPSRGTISDKGKPVELVISKGISKVAVPELKGMSPTEAQAELAKLNLLFKTVPKESPAKDKNLVTGQNPKALTFVKPKTTVTVQVGSGPEFTTIPKDLVGKSYTEVEQVLEKAKLSAIKVPIDSFEPRDQVLKVLGAAPGSSVQAGSPVQLQVSNNALFKVPNLANGTPDDAAVALKQAGWLGSRDKFKVLSVATTESTLIGRIPDSNQQVVPDPTHPEVKVDTPPQNPAPDKLVNRQAVFTLVTYSKLQIVLPKFTSGASRYEVADQVRALGFTSLEILLQRPAPTLPQANTFVAMTPEGNGTAIDYDTPIVMTAWGDFPPPPTTPTTPTTPPTTPSTTTAAQPTTTAAAQPTTTAAPRTTAAPTRQTTPPPAVPTVTKTNGSAGGG